MNLDRKNVTHGAIPVGKVMSLSSAFTTTSYNTVPPAPGLEWGTLSASTDGYVLTCSAAAAEGVAWAANAAMLNPMTTAGDLITGGTSGAPARLGMGTANQVLQVNAGATALAWGTTLTNPLTTAGDVMYGGAAGAPTRLAVGTATQVLTVNSRRNSTAVVRSHAHDHGG